VFTSPRRRGVLHLPSFAANSGGGGAPSAAQLLPRGAARPEEQQTSKTICSD